MVRVVYFPTLTGKAAAKPTELYEGVHVPESEQVSRLHHFAVVERRYDTKKGDLIFAIGPRLPRDQSVDYRHEDLKKMVERELGKSYPLRGERDAEIVGREYGIKYFFRGGGGAELIGTPYPQVTRASWKLLITTSHTSRKRFDPSILTEANSQSIARAFGIMVSFHWQSYVSG